MKNAKKSKAVKSDDGPLSIGGLVLIRTVTHYHVGRVIALRTICGCGFVELEAASWIADTGRFSDALTSGVFNEVEPFKNSVLVGLGAIVDATAWDGPIPLCKK